MTAAEFLLQAEQIEAMIVAKQLPIMAQWHEKISLGAIIDWESLQYSGKRHAAIVVREVSREEYLNFLKAIGGSEDDLVCPFYYELRID